MKNLKYIYWIAWFLGVLSISQAEQLGQWQSLNSQNTSRFHNIVVLSRDTIIYTLGGFPYDDTPYPVEQSIILPNGTLSPWKEESTWMISARGEAVGFATDSYVYAMGGYNSSVFLNTIERALIKPDGSLGNWTIVGETPASEIIRAGGAVYNKKYCYIMGGYPGISTTYRATIQADGSIGTWSLLTAQLVTGREWLTSIVINTSLYVVGGYDSYGVPVTSIEKATIYPNGDLSSFTNISNSVAGHITCGLCYDGVYLNIIGGWVWGSYNYRSERVKVNLDGSLETWEPAPALQVERNFFGYVQSSTGAYVIDGYLNGDSNLVEYAPILNLPPIFSNIPNLKLFTGQSLDSAFNLENFNTGDINTTYSILSNFLNLSILNSSTVSQLDYSSATSGTNIYVTDNIYGEGTATNQVKYSTYKIHRLPQLVLRPNQSWEMDVGSYTFDSSNHLVIPPSYNQNNSFMASDSLIVSDTTQLRAIWSNPSTISITAFSGFTCAQDVEVIASPQSSAPFGRDIDKERIEIFPALSTTAFEFNSSSDTSIFSFQAPAGVSSLAKVEYTTAVEDIHGGALQITFSSLSSGIKITPKFTAWLHNIPQSWYTLRIRVMGTNTTNSYLQILYNGNPGSSPTDVQGYFRYSVPTSWTYMDIPINSFDRVSSTPVMYPQIVLRANGGTGIVYIDEMEIFQGTPPLLTSRYKTSDNYAGGTWKDSDATTQWGMDILSGAPNISVINNQLIIYTSGNNTTRSSLKFTASSLVNTIYTVPANMENQAGMHISTQLVSGITNVELTQVQLNMLGTKNNGSFITSGDIASAAEIGRISNRTLHLAFTANSPFYQVQFIVKNIGTSSIQLDNTLADIQNDEGNYGDATLFP